VVAWSSHAERLTGYTLEQINGVGPVEIFSPKAVMDHLLGEAHNGLTTFGGHLQLRRRDGALVHVRVQCLPVRHLNSIEGRVVVVMRSAPLTGFSVLSWAADAKVYTYAAASPQGPLSSTIARCGGL
jgi:hypothetical protein